MKGYELDKFIISYFDRVAIRDACYLQGHSSTDKTFYKINKERSKTELSIFICDAMIIKDFEYDGNAMPCRNPTFSGNCIQFYLLNHDQLFSYIIFRTMLKKGKVPSDRSAGFLTLLLMEIVNDIYGCSFTYKFNELNRIYSIFPKSEAYEDLFKEAFEIIYIQNKDSLKIEEYAISTPLSVFENTSLMPFYEEKKQKNIVKTMVNSVNSLSKYKISDIELFIFNDCFKFITDKLERNIYLESHRYCTIEQLVYPHNDINVNSPLRHLMAQYPLKTNFSYVNTSGVEERFKYGLHTKAGTTYTKQNNGKICYATLEIFNSIALYCDYNVRDEDTGELIPRYQMDYNVRDEDTGELIPRYQMVYNVRDEDTGELIPRYQMDYNDYSYGRINQTVLNVFMEKWVWDNQYAKIGYRLSLSELKKIKINGVNEKDKLAFDQWKDNRTQEYNDNKTKQINIKKNQELRNRMEMAERLQGISPYISIEEKQAQFDEMISLNIKANKIFYERENKLTSIKTKPKDDTSSRFVESLSTLERGVLVMLCYDNFDGADDAAWNNDDMISNVIDSINVKSNKYLECNVIEDTEVIEKFIKKILSEIE